MRGTDLILSARRAHAIGYPTRLSVISHVCLGSIDLYLASGIRSHVV